MKYIIPKYFLPNLNIVESNKIFKIKHYTQDKYQIVIFGILLNLNNIRINKNFNDYQIVTNSNFDELKTYDNFLSKNIPNYKSILKNNSILVSNNKIKSDDQKRVQTPKKAIKLGADYLVIGRPITESRNPLKVLKEINQTLL